MRVRENGFTLLEVIVVVVILGIVGSVVLARGPAHSARQDLRTASAILSGALRATRAQAIATDRPVLFALDPASGTWRIGGDAPHRLPGGIAIAAPARGVLFTPDGASTGGQITLGSGSLRMAIAIDWLTGRTAAGLM